MTEQKQFVTTPSRFARSGDIYVADVSAAGEYYEKPMINLQQKIYELEARIAALESEIPEINKYKNFNLVLNYE